MKEVTRSSDLFTALRKRTPARLFVGRAGVCLPTATQLELRRDHAAAIDAVQRELDLERDLGRDFVSHWNVLALKTRARDKNEYLLRPDLGRRLDAASASELRQSASRQADLQIAIGDGLSATAVMRQVPTLLPFLADGARAHSWSLGRILFIRHCRVGVLNDIGDLLDPVVVVLLIGERPGLATAESLSAYMAYRPRAGHTDAQRNLISNIHGQGLPCDVAASRILRLAARMRAGQASGVAVKEEIERKGESQLPLS